MANEITNIYEEKYNLKNENKLIQNDLLSGQQRCTRMNIRTDDTKKNHKKRENLIETEIHKIKQKINSVLDGKQNSTLRCDALERYMELILGINGDLSRYIYIYNIHVSILTYILRIYTCIYVLTYNLLYSYICIYRRIADSVSARAYIRDLADSLTPPRYAW
jgi:hypothetical protein